MRTSWRLGRAAGIDVYLHPTFLLVPLFMIGSPAGFEGLALVLSAFGCVLLHEFGHALTARRFGIETADITLYPIGGVARLRRIPKAPGVELAVALAGPAVNVLIAATLVVLLAAGRALDLPFVSGEAAAFALQLVWINLLLAGFNMLPAFPMDGGRVLRAVLSGWLGRVRATGVAAGIGRVLAVVGGVFAIINGMWAQVFLALFVFVAATAEYASVLREDDENHNPHDDDRGVWNAPPGHRWVSRGQGAWQLQPIRVTSEPRSHRRFR